MTKVLSGFTIRVYGVFIDEFGRLLLTDEFRLGNRMTKFPGGGLELGEGPIDCLKRECREELKQEIEVLSHFYTTGFYQPTYLLETPKQLISIYYRIDIPRPYKFIISGKKFDYGEEVEGAQSFRLVRLDKLAQDDLSFPVDQYVLNLLQRVSER